MSTCHLFNWKINPHVGHTFVFCPFYNEHWIVHLLGMVKKVSEKLGSYLLDLLEELGVSLIQLILRKGYVILEHS